MKRTPSTTMPTSHAVTKANDRAAAVKRASSATSAPRPRPPSSAPRGRGKSK